jgi:PAS domain S-box-containing protein
MSKGDRLMPSPRILIVTNETSIRTNLVNALEGQGYEVVGTIAAKKQAVRAAAKAGPDVVLFEIGEADRAEVIDIASRIRRTLGVPIIYVIAHSNREFLEQTKATEPYGYLTQPASEAQVWSVVETALARHKVEKRLKETWERLDLALEVSGMAIWDWKVRTRQVLPDRHWGQILEIAPEDVGTCGDWWLKVIHPDDVSVLKASMDAHLEGRAASYEVEFRVRTKSGTWKWMLGRGTVMERDGDGNPLRVAGTAIDITDRKRAEALLVAQQELSAALSRQSDLNEALELCMQKAIAVSGMDSAGIYLVNKNLSLDLAVHTGLSQEFVGTVRHLPRDSSRARSILQGRMAYLETSEHGKSLRPEFKREGLKSCAVIPIVHEGQVVACFNVSSHEFSRIEPCSRQALEAIAGQMGAAVARKLAEESLRRNEELFRTIVATSPVGILLARNRVMEWMSEPFAKMFGFRHPDECVGRSAKIIYASDEEYERVGDILYRGLESGAVTAVDAKFQRQDGSVFDGHLKMKALDPGDPGKGVVSTVSDISDRKRAELDLQLEKERFETLAHNAPFGMILVGQDGTFEYLNPTFRELFGYDLSDIPSGRTWLGRAFPDPTYRHEVIAAWLSDLERFEAGATKARTFIVTCKDGSRKTIHFRTVLLSTGSHLVTCEDITERVLADEARMRLATAVEQAAEVIVITDTGGTIQYVNPAFETVTGFKSAEAIGQNPRFLQSGEHDRAFYETLWKTISRGEAWTGRFINKKKNGDLYQEVATISPVRDSRGKIINYVAVKRDVTQEVHLEKQLLQAQKMEAIGTMAGGISHDFNNLLQVVLGFVDLLIMDARKTGRKHGELLAIAKAARDGAELVRRLLTFSSKVETKPRPLDLNHVVNQAEQLLRRTIPKMIDITIKPTENLKRISADPAQIEQLLLNLAVNSRDAMPEGGKLVIETANVYLDDHYCATHVEAIPGHYVVLTISDSGCGMEKDVVDRIYEPFFTTKKPGEGTGLGLAMVYGIVKGHGGYITCYSEPGFGTTFKIYLPAIEMDMEPDVASSGEMPAFGSETILLVDDEDLIRELGMEILNRSGYTVLTAANGKEALNLYRACADGIDLVILDLIMPEMGGKQCLAELLKFDPGAKVLLASGYPAAGPANEALEAAAKGFINKPFDAKELLQSIRRVLDRS